jgi:hypothetical protein
MNLCPLPLLSNAATPQNKDRTEGQLLGFAYDFGVTVGIVLLPCS